VAGAARLPPLARWVWSLRPRHFHAPRGPYHVTRQGPDRRAGPNP
jgi:hypothetical protein